MRARDIMSAPVITVIADTPLKDLAALLIKREISAVPVVDEHGDLIGIVSEADLVALETTPDPRSQMIRYPAPRNVPTLVREVMTEEVVALPETADIAWIADQMLDKHIKRIPIVSGVRVVGIVSRRDLLKVLARSDVEIRSDLQEVLDAEADVLGALRVHVSQGVARIEPLRGRLERNRLRLAERVAQGVPGVVEVKISETA